MDRGRSRPAVPVADAAKPGRVISQIDITLRGEADRLAAGAAIPDVDAIADLGDLGLEVVELLQGVAGAVQSVDCRVQRTDTGARRHPLQPEGPELEEAAERRAGDSVVVLTLDVEVAADQPVEPAGILQHLAEVGDIEEQLAPLPGRRDTEGRALARTDREIGIDEGRLSVTIVRRGRAVAVMMDDHLESCWNAFKPQLALYIGGMGARGKNFYYDLACRYGYEDAANTIQDLYLRGDKAEAVSAVPNELVDDVSLCGPKARIKERLSLWQNSPVTTLNMMVYDVDTLRAMAELVL